MKTLLIQATLVTTFVSFPLFAEEKPAYTKVSVDTAAFIKKANRQMDSSAVVGSIPANSRSLDAALAKIPGVIAQAQNTGLEWPKDQVFDPDQAVYATEAEFTHLRKSYAVMIFSNSPELTYGIAIVKPDRVLGTKHWVVVPVPRS